MGPLCDPQVTQCDVEKGSAGGASTPRPPGPQLQELLLPQTLGNSPGEASAVLLMAF